MKISSLRIKNFRSFADTTITLDGYNCLVGANGAGKSTILQALNVFFREPNTSFGDLAQLTAADFHKKNTADPVEIIVTFAELSEDAKHDFSDYFRQDALVISAIAKFDEKTGVAEVRQVGQRLGIAAFAPFFRANGDKQPVAQLREQYVEIRKTFAELPAATTKDAMVSALQAYESEHRNDTVLLPSEDDFYGVSRGTNRLAKYVQWVFIPAVKDVSGEQVESKTSALGRLLARTVRSKVTFDATLKELRTSAREKYKEMLEGSQGALTEISTSLANRLSEWAHPGITLKLEWTQDLDKSIRVDEPFARIFAGEGSFEGELTRFGHGVQRSYLLALLHELANTDDSEGPRLILGCEEPELYQHPPQARHLSGVLKRLAERNSQVIVATHHPVFVSGDGFENVRLVTRALPDAAAHVRHMSYKQLSEDLSSATGEPARKPEGVLAKIHQALQPSLSEMFFTPRLVLVEGLEDVAYLTAYLNLTPEIS